MNLQTSAGVFLSVPGCGERPAQARLWAFMDPQSHFRFASGSLRGCQPFRTVLALIAMGASIPLPLALPAERL